MTTWLNPSTHRKATSKINLSSNSNIFTRWTNPRFSTTRDTLKWRNMTVCWKNAIMKTTIFFKSLQFSILCNRSQLKVTWTYRVSKTIKCIAANLILTLTNRTSSAAILNNSLTTRMTLWLKRIRNIKFLILCRLLLKVHQGVEVMVLD